jgi:FkbM family methyltransferase
MLLARLIYNYGLLKGTWLLIKIKLSSGKLKLPGLKHPVYFRKNSTDFVVLYSILLAKSYRVTISKPPKIIIDAGANVGYASVYFANCFPEATIYAIEPDYNNFKILQKNTNVYPQIICLRKAIWNRHSLIKIKNMDNGEWAYMIEEAEDDKDTIEAITLAELTNQYNISLIDILKVDIEGSEKEVFSGDYKEWLGKTKCLIIEVHDGLKKGCSKAVFKATTYFNFSFKRSGENLVFINDDL